ncbi:unnamed protein product [Lampetra planeri]
MADGREGTPGDAAGAVKSSRARRRLRAERRTARATDAATARRRGSRFRGRELRNGPAHLEGEEKEEEVGDELRRTRRGRARRRWSGSRGERLQRCGLHGKWRLIDKSVLALLQHEGPWEHKPQATMELLMEWSLMNWDRPRCGRRGTGLGAGTLAVNVTTPRDELRVPVQLQMAARSETFRCYWQGISRLEHRGLLDTTGSFVHAGGVRLLRPHRGRIRQESARRLLWVPPSAAWPSDRKLGGGGGNERVSCRPLSSGVRCARRSGGTSGERPGGGVAVMSESAALSASPLTTGSADPGNQAATSWEEGGEEEEDEVVGKLADCTKSATR